MAQLAEHLVEVVEDGKGGPWWLELEVQKAIGLAAMDVTGTSDPYVKVHVGRRQARKTAIRCRGSCGSRLTSKVGWALISMSVPGTRH